MITPKEFKQLIEKQQKSPESLPKAVQALWYDYQGNWDKAHEIVQNASDADSAWVHAYLHRKEGDLSNARYWYRRCGKPEFHAGLDREWEEIASNLLTKVKELWMPMN
ncbi:hypothetical protein ACF3DV_23660 [Chlorogloeopsis fritschii PCC 9212]|uniref:Uncharacterized protein n=1 Tax=Chlorogloeopsis fritschii PCC 6912 TaxID=211165 RepID=A0A3S0ZXF9_CHLFR|nr:hypothetical protein [Chlorogloeopsis fritschii]RUR86007.1 hypothetical protein PCC6912_08320 [Chlorogloeopsis fritschii PCC 6912]